MDWKPIEAAGRELKDGRRLLGFGTILGEYGYSEDEETHFFIKWIGAFPGASKGRWVLDQPVGRYSRGVVITHYADLDKPPKKNKAPDQ